MAEAFAEMSKRKDLECFCIGEESIYAILAGMLTADGENYCRRLEKEEKAKKKAGAA